MTTDELVKRLAERVDRIEARMAGSKPSQTQRAGEAKVAFNPEDPTVKVVPKSWRGDEMRGRTFSQCPPEFLGQLAAMLDSFANKNEQDPERERYAKWDRQNAITARRWRDQLEGKQELFPSAPMSDAEIERAF